MVYMAHGLGRRKGPLAEFLLGPQRRGWVKKFFEYQVTVIHITPTGCQSYIMQL